MVIPGAVAGTTAAEHAGHGPVFLDDVALLPPGPNATPSASLLVACDSLGGIGPKEHDRVPADPYTVGRLTCRVPLLEILALGGQPLLVVVTLAVEPEPTGEQILVGVRDEAYQAGVPGHAFLVSTEKNVPTTQTGLGVTVVGRVHALRYGLSLPGDVVVTVGIPKVGKDVTLLDPEIADISTLRIACAFPSLHDIVPVGSGGIRSEADKIARRGRLRFLPGATRLDLDKSAGPSTCFLVSLPAADWPAFERHMAPTGRPCSPVGRLWPEDECG